MSSGSLRSKLEDVTASEVTRLLSIRVRDGDSTRAALIANAVADELVAYSREERPGTAGGRAANRRARNRHQRRDRPVGATDRPAGRRRRPSRRVRSRRGRGRSLDRSPERAGTGRARSSGRSRLDQRNAAPVQEPTVRGRGRSRLPSCGCIPPPRHEDRALERRRRAGSVLVLDAHGGRSGSRLALNLAGALAEGGGRVALIHHGDEGDRRSSSGSREMRHPRAASVEGDRCASIGSRSTGFAFDALS